MKYNAHDYQAFATKFIIDKPTSAILLEMGLGKSVITLTAIFDLVLDCFEIRKVLVIAPLRVTRDTWPAEIEKWDHLRGLTYSVAVGSEKQRVEAMKKIADIYLINRENVDWLVNKSGLPFDFDMIVIDELSSFKDYSSKRFKALKKIRPKVKRIVGLTGTPSSNGLIDLWAEIGILDMGARLGRFIGRFREEYFIPDKRNQQMVFSYKPHTGAEDKIYQKISDICISMKSTDYLDMPDCVYNEIPVKLSPKEAEMYKKLKSEMVLTLDNGDIDAANAVGLSNKLLQMANGAVYDEKGTARHIHDCKLDALEDLIEAANGKPVLIAYWFKHDYERINERFNVQKLDTSESITKWNRREIAVAAIHPASAGHGLNLQAGGSTLIWFGLTWSLELYQQTNARLWRQGQKDTVVIQHIITQGTIDEDVMKALKNKDTVQSALIDAVKVNLKES